MTTAREIMAGSVQRIGENKTLADTARKLQVINGHDLAGMLTLIAASRALPLQGQLPDQLHHLTGHLWHLFIRGQTDNKETHHGDA